MKAFPDSLASETTSSKIGRSPDSSISLPFPTRECSILPAWLPKGSHGLVVITCARECSRIENADHTGILLGPNRPAKTLFQLLLHGRHDRYFNIFAQRRILLLLMASDLMSQMDSKILLLSPPFLGSRPDISHHPGRHPEKVPASGDQNPRIQWSRPDCPPSLAAATG